MIIIFALLAWCASAVGLLACCLAWREHQERRRQAGLAKFWGDLFQTAAAELDRRDAIDAEARDRRVASAKHARAAQLERERALRNATTAKLRRAA